MSLRGGWGGEGRGRGRGSRDPHLERVLADLRERAGGSEAGRPRLGAVRLFPRLVLAAMRCAPWSSLVLAVAAVSGGLVTALELLIARELVDALAAALGFASAAEGAGEGAAGSAGGGSAFLTVFPWIVWLAAAMAAATALELLGNLAEADVQERVGMQMQRDVVEKAHSVELVHFEHPSFYDALQRANQDMGARLTQLLRGLVDVLAALTGMAAVLAVLWQAHWALAPIMAVGVAPGFWVMLTMRRKTYWVYRVRTPESRLANYFGNLLTRRDEAKEVRLFTLTRHLLERWLNLARALAIERRQLELKQAWLGALTDVVGLAAYAGCLVIIAVLIAGAKVSVGTFAMMMQALQQFGARIEQVMRHLSSLHEQSLYLADLYEFLAIDAPVEADAADRRELAAPHRAGPGAGPATAGAPASASGTAASRKHASRPSVSISTGGDPPEAVRIELENVSFRYPGSDKLVLQNVNLVIEPGERIALIGENGAGKSTLVRILMGLYRPTEGRVLLNGRDLQEIPTDEVRRMFAAVFQEFVRYQFPVAENIRFGRLADATEADIRWAAQLSGAAAFIETLPEGYNTLLGRPLGGLDLSGGEWQKLAIARAIVRRAPVVVLDEPTAALDPKAEAEVYRQFAEITAGRTAILISHRLGSARLADRIVVLKGGRIVEMGTHEALIAQGGEYAGFFELQAQWYR